MEHYRRGIVYFNQKEYEQAVSAFENALAVIGERNNPYHSLGRFYAAEAHAKLGLSRHRQGRMEEARGHFEAALSQGYRYPDLHYLLARILEAENDQEGAEKECRQALEINQGYVEARALLAIVLWKRGEAEEALHELRHLASSQFRLPDRLNLDLATHLDDGIFQEIREETARRQESHEYLGRALEAYDRGDRATAITALRAAVEQKPTYADLRCKLGILYLETGVLDLAEQELSAALEINPNYVEARLQMGLLLLMSNRPEDAAEHLALAERLQPGYPDVVLFRGVAELRRGDIAQARDIIEAILERQPAFHRARYFLALTLATLGDGEASMAEMRRALEGDPSLTRARSDLAHMVLQRGEREYAHGLFRAVTERSPDFPDAHLGLGLVLMEKGKRSEARQHLQRAVQLQEGFVRALMALARLELLESNLPAAEDCLRQALARQPRYPDLHFMLGQCLEKQQKVEEAVKSYECALMGNPCYVDARLALGMLLLKGGDARRGRAEMGEVLQLDPTHPVAKAFADPHLLQEL